MKEKETYKLSEKWSILVHCSSYCSLAFCATDLFPGNFIDFRFMTFTEFWMKNLAPILIHVSKIFNCRVNYSIFQNALVNVPHNCWEWILNVAVIKQLPKYHCKKKITMIMIKVILIQTKCPFLPLVLNENNNNEHTECHGIFMPFKGEICSKKIIISSCLNEAKVSTVNSDLQISLTFNECMKTLNELCVFTEFSYTLFTKRLLLIRISLLKHVIYRRVNAS